ncbi:MAG: ribosome silencing factor [Armatimonadetes bacterium]|nr:ribosome silencing factor [Armatimonadota bacterium]
MVLEIGDLTHLAHYFVICHGTSDRQVRAIADRLEEAADQRGEQLHHREGAREARWILLDYSDVVVHVFDADTRERFRLEDLWADAPRTALAAA